MIKTQEAKSNETKESYDITAKMSVKEAMQMILISLLRKMSDNEQGVIDDTASDYLHHYRVSTRKARSAIHLIKGFFPEQCIKTYSYWFSRIAKATNKLRDMDVFLLSEHEFKSRLPLDMQSYLNPFFSYLSVARNTELNTVKVMLLSCDYKSIIDDWEIFIETRFLELANAESANEPIVQVANTALMEQYHKIVEMGQVITDASPYPQLHSLRIQCKKLRYWLEFFTALYPEEDVLFAMNNLKQLQDILGRLNDLHIQSDLLKAYAEGNDLKPENVKAIRIFIQQHEEEQAEVRSHFRESFHQFSNTESQKLIQQLFA